MFQTPNLPNLPHLALLGHLHLCRQNCGVFQAPVSLIKAQWVHQMIFAVPRSRFLYYILYIIYIYVICIYIYVISIYIHNGHVCCESFDDKLVCRGTQGTAIAKAIGTLQVVQGSFNILNIPSILAVMSKYIHGCRE